MGVQTNKKGINYREDGARRLLSASNGGTYANLYFLNSLNRYPSQLPKKRKIFKKTNLSTKRTAIIFGSPRGD